jgi:KDO2-lipid IV(A) lauroyltransferase
MGGGGRKRTASVPLRARLAFRLKKFVASVTGRLAVALLKALRRTDPDRMADRAAAFMRRVGPFLPEHRTGRANLTAAFPEKSAAEVEAILREVWAQVGRVGIEYAHLDRLWDFDLANPEAGRIVAARESIERYLRLRDDGRPALVFAAHLANWELPALAAAQYGVDAAILYRAPSVGDIAAAVQRIRALNMGTLIATGPQAPIAVAAALERGAHVGMLVDQHFSRGVEVKFFGRTCRANPMIARLARHYACPIHGTRAIRLPGRRFRLELTEELVPRRDGNGEIDVQATMQQITDVIEGWVREHPEQWLWLHRRWR